MICWFENNNNNRSKNIQGVYLCSSQSSVNHGLVLEKENLRHSITLFVSRRLISSSYIDGEDVYFKPPCSIYK
jgi:hypothetical protein